MITIDDADTASLRRLQAQIGQINIVNGWRAADPNTVDHAIAVLALITTEVAEAIEEIRNGHAVDETYYHNIPYSPKVRKPEGVPSELADVVIRAFDVADIYHIDLASIIFEKLAYNETRGYRHGGKTA